MWYAIERLLDPERDPQETYKSMLRYLTRTDPKVTMRKIIISFMKLININDAGIINDKKIIYKDQLKQIIGGRNKYYKGKTRKNKRRCNKYSKKSI